MTDTVELLQQKLALMEEERDLRLALPHKYLHPFYQWQEDYVGSTNKVCFLVAANQCGKSTCNLIKAITWATEPSLWSSLWPTIRVPEQARLFWYLYPNQDIVNTEFEVKWKTYLPKGRMKDDPQYGWTELKKGSDIMGISFNSGITLEFKTYSQKLVNIQTVTLLAVFTDEELPFLYYPELTSRMNATNGYFNMVFTATLGQEEWRCAIEEKGDKETFKAAYKRNVSLYDCMFYTDGTPGVYTEARIKQIINSYPTEAEVLRRVFGRFVVSEGLIYPGFSRKHNVVEPYSIEGWEIRAAMDYGTGGKNHKSAVLFLAVRKDRKKGAFFTGWKGDDKRRTTEKDLVDKFVEIKGPKYVARTIYDYAAKDVERIGLSMNIAMERADKSHERGEGIMNSLFKNKMLDVFDVPELLPFILEATSLKVTTPKNKRDDDMTDCGRYDVISVNWDFSDVTGDSIIKGPELDDREKGRQLIKNQKSENSIDVEKELQEWSDRFEV